jgi:hypothetical protein
VNDPFHHMEASGVAVRCPISTIRLEAGERLYRWFARVEWTLLMKPLGPDARKCLLILGGAFGREIIKTPRRIHRRTGPSSKMNGWLPRAAHGEMLTHTEVWYLLGNAVAHHRDKPNAFAVLSCIDAPSLLKPSVLVD